jgi:hypothetical protein
LTLQSQKARDLAVAAWVALWIVLGVVIGVNVDDLTALSHTVSRDGEAVAQIGGTLGVLHALPLIGGQVGGIAGAVRRAGEDAAASGATSASSVHTLALLLGVAVCLLPSIPVMVFYLPARRRRAREARALRELVLLHGGRPELETYLARRAALTLDLDALARSGITPWREIHADQRAALAAAEVRRAGLDPGLLRAVRQG